MSRATKSEAQDPRPVILVVFPGPTYELDEALERRLALLSRYFRGYVLTSRHERECCQMSAFEVVAVSMPKSRFKHATRYLHEVERFRRNAGPGERIQLVVAYDPLLCGVVALAAAHRFNAPLIVEVNGDFREPANYHQPGRGIVSQSARRWRNVWTARRVLERVDGIKTLYPEQLERLGFTPDRQQIASFPELTATESFVDLGENPEILLTGYPYQVKGVDLLLDAFLRIAPDYPDWKLRILGFYPDKSCFPAQALEHPRIELVDPVPHSEVPGIIGRCGIFALPSRTEGMGRVLVEAMGAGKARIGTRVGGIPTTIEDGVDGLLVPPEDPAALADALRRLIDSPDLRRKFGARGAERARTEFSEDAYARNVKSFYDAVLAKAAKPRARTG